MVTASTLRGMRRHLVAAWFALVAALVTALMLLSPTQALADDDWVNRLNPTDMINRSSVVLYQYGDGWGIPSLKASGIKILGGGATLDSSREYAATWENGDRTEYIISFDYVNTAAGKVCPTTVEAVYQDVGYETATGRKVTATMTLSDFTFLSASEVSVLKARDEGGWVGITSGRANLILSESLDCGFWFIGLESAEVEVTFAYSDTGESIDLSTSFLSVRSLDKDNNWGDRYGQEAVMVTKSFYKDAFLTPGSTVGRWGAVTGRSGKTYGDGLGMNSATPLFFESEVNDYYEVSNSIRNVTFYGVTKTAGSTAFRFKMIDTEGITHNSVYFGTLSTVRPPEPTKRVVDADTGKDYVVKSGVTEPVTYDDGYRLGDEVTFNTYQYVPGREEQLGTYTYVKFTDEISDDLTVKSVKVYDEDGNVVTGGSSTGAGVNSVEYSFDQAFVASDAFYGHTYRLEVVCEVTDYPEDDALLIPNTAKTYFGANNGDLVQETNEVKVHLISPELEVEKHLVIDDNASVINDYEYLVGDVVTFEAEVFNKVASTRAKNVTFYDDMPVGLDYIEGSVELVEDHGGSVALADRENGWQATFTNFDYNKPVKVRYKAYATEAGNGKEVINVAEAWATNIPKDVDGAETKHATNESECYINDPNLDLTKSVTVSKIQESDYTRGEEYRVGDVFTYQVTMVNTEPGTFAENVILADDDMPAGFELVGNVQVTGLDAKGNPKTVEVPKHFDDDKHGEQESYQIIWQRKDLEREGGTWGWELDVNWLAYNQPVTVTWQVRATQETNGWEVYNRAWAEAENQPADHFLSRNTTDDAGVDSDYTIVWVNTPEFQVEKTVRQTESTYQVGDVAAYDVVLRELKTPGTLARLTTLEDAFQTEGTTIVENSFVITDRTGNAVDFRDGVKLNRFAESQGWHIDMTQAYGDETGYWISGENCRYEFKDGELVKLEGEKNPVGVLSWHNANAHSSADGTSDSTRDGTASSRYGNEYFKVHYEATINDAALQNELIVNKATADSKEGFPVEDEAEVTVIGAALEIVKTSTDKGAFEAGDVATYELDVTNGATGTTAKNVFISDKFTTAKAGAVSIVDGSVKLKDAKGNVFAQASEQNPDGWEIEWVNNESGTHFGFALTTNQDLRWDGKLVVTYDVKYLTNNGSEKLVNIAHAKATNAPEVEDDHETWPADADQSDLIIDKGSNKQQYAVGDTGTYTLHVTNQSDVTALNVVINDDFADDTVGICHVIKGSVKITDERGNAVSAKVTYHQVASGNLSGFTAETGHDLTPDESMDVTYQVYFEKAAQKTAVDNSCWAAADNTGKATDDHEVILTPDGGSTPQSDDDPKKNEPVEPKKDEPVEPKKDEPADPKKDDPVDPTDPSDPTNPEDPDDPADPDDPTDPADPADPADPSDPTDPTAPTITKAVSNSTPAPGETVTYVITVTAGENALTEATVTDTPDDGVAVNLETVHIMVDGAKLENPKVEQGDDGVLVFGLGDLAKGSKATISYDAVVDEKDELVGKRLPNTAVLTAKDLEPLTAEAVVTPTEAAAPTSPTISDSGTPSGTTPTISYASLPNTGDVLTVAVPAGLAVAATVSLAGSLFLRRKGHHSK